MAAILRSFSDTKVSFGSSQGKVMDLLVKHHVHQVGWEFSLEDGDAPGELGVYFALDNHRYRVCVRFQSRKGPRGGQAGTTKEQAARALFWHLKSLFDAIDWGIVEFSQAFFAYELTNTGATTYETYYTPLVGPDGQRSLTHAPEGCR